MNASSTALRGSPCAASFLSMLGVGLVAALTAAPLADARAETTLFGSDNMHLRLFELDPVTGAATLVGPLTFENLRDIAYDIRNKSLISIDTVTDQIVRIDPASAGGRSIGRLATDTDPFFASLDFHPKTGELYGLDYNSSAIYRIDLATRRLTRVVRLSTEVGSAGCIAFRPDGTLFVTDTVTDVLGTLDLETGEVTPIGAHPNAGYVTAMTFDPASGRLYGVDSQRRMLVELSTTTGAARLRRSHRISFITGLAARP